MTRLQFNQNPYFDDFDKRSNQIRVLYKPGRAVQGRELNVAQSIMLGQMESFGNHIFKNGSKVSNGRSTFTSYDYVRLRANNPTTGLLLNVEQFAEGSIVKGVASGLTAKIVKSVNAENADPATLFVVYTNTAIDGTTTVFVPGETLEFLDENSIVVYRAEVRCPSCPGSSEGTELFPTGKGHIFTVDEGVFYFEGMFINTARQSIIVSKYSGQKGVGVLRPFTGKKVGFDFIQSIVTSDDDVSLLDPSLGYPNATAPGADRYKVELTLTARSYDAQDGEDFILLAKINDNYVMEFQKTDSEYADLADTLAKRTFETNGNYTVLPFVVSWYEHLKKDAADALGWDLAGSEENVLALMSPGLGYVRGYRVEKIADTPIVIKKARSTKNSASFIKRFDPRSSVTLRPTTQVVWPNGAAETNLVGNTLVQIFDQPNALGNQIGTVKIVDIKKVSGLASDLTAEYEYGIVDLQLSVGKTLADAKSFANAVSVFKADVVPNPATTKFDVNASSNSALVFPIDKQNIKSIRDSDNNLNGSLSISIRKKLKAVLDNTGKATFSSSTNEFFEPLSNSTIAYVTSSANVTRTLDLNGTNCVISPTSLTINLTGADSGSTVTILTSTLKTNQKEKRKTLLTLVHTTPTAPVNTVGTQVPLTVADAFKLDTVEVYDHSNVGSPVFVGDVTANYALYTNTDDWYYKESYIKLTKQIANISLNNNQKLHVTFKYFQHTGAEGYFTVDSYADAINDPLNNLTFEDIPSFTSTAGIKTPLSSAFDFRSILLAGSVSGSVPAENTAIFDCEFYLPRSDIIQISKDGKLYVKYGSPSETPALPSPDQDSMVLYQVFLNAYTYSIDDIKTKFIENKRYTMRDIGRLESRISNIEYYTTLTLLEQKANSANIKDANGLDRFKNGLITDNFQDFQSADLGNLEWKAAADRTRRELRPQFKASNAPLKVIKDVSAGARWHGNFATLPYTDEICAENPYATKHLSINPYFVFAAKGTVVLSPNNDTWSDEERLPTVTTTIDTGVDALRSVANAAGVLGSSWGSWVNQNTTIVTNPIGGSLDTITTTAQDARTRTDRTIEARTQEYTIDNIVKDVRIIPYMRSRVVEFHAANMRPNTRIYAFFDEDPVSEFCRDAGFGLTTANATQRLAQIEYGSPMFTDNVGSFNGEFRIPAGRFFTGKSKFKLTDDVTNTDQDQVTTFAEATYFAGGLDITKQDYTLNLITPTFAERQTREARTTTTSVTFDRSPPPAPEPAFFPPVEEVIPPPAPPPIPGFPPAWHWVWNGTSYIWDPVAQQFFIDEDQFITSLDLFFYQVDLTSDTIWIEIRDMVNGYPGTQALARKEYKPNQIAFSADSSTPFKVTFDIPVYVKAGGDYCFVIGGNSPNTRIWLSKLGQEVVNMPGKMVETQPTPGSSFRSQNNITWNAEQFEDIKFKMYRARFNESSMSLYFENGADIVAPIVLEENPIETQAGSDLVRIYLRDHGLTTDDRFTLSLYEGSTIRIACNNLPPQIGQRIVSSTGSGYIEDVKKDGATAGHYILTLTKMEGAFVNASSFVAEAMVKSYRNETLIGWVTGNTPSTIQINESVGTFRENSVWGTYISGLINGIPVIALNKEHTVKDVDSTDSFIIQVSAPANVSHRAGGATIKAFDVCRKFETFNVSGAYMPYNCSESWRLSGIGHGDQGTLFEGDNYIEQPQISFKVAVDQGLPKPFKIASRRNEVRSFGENGRKSIGMRADFTSSNTLISPVVDAESFSLTSISNRIDFITAETFEIIPNAANRFIPETNPLLGSEVYKYVTNTVRLANSASDLVIYFDYYKDVNADFDVYVKTVPVYNARGVDEYDWVKCDIPVKKNSADLVDRTELTIKCSDAVAGWGEEFQSFKVKIVGKSRNSAKPPFFYDFRAIAVT